MGQGLVGPNVFSIFLHYVFLFPPFAAVRPPSQGGVSQKAGNLLQATEDYIIHQCNCPRAARQMSMEIVDML